LNARADKIKLAFTPEEQNAILVAHNITLTVSSGPDGFYGVNNAKDPRSNVVINGVSVTRGTSPTGTWGWLVEFSAEESGLIEYNLTVVAGQ
jgi:hypothetical protein